MVTEEIRRCSRYKTAALNSILLHLYRATSATTGERYDQTAKWLGNIISQTVKKKIGEHLEWVASDYQSLLKPKGGVEKIFTVTRMFVNRLI